MSRNLGDELKFMAMAGVRMTARSALCMAIGLVLASTTVLADHVNHSLATARGLVANCASNAPSMQAMCLGYLAAISDGVARHQAMGSTKRMVCVPTVVDLVAYRDAFLQFMKNNPEAVQWHSFEAVQDALRAAWPCQQ